MKPEYTYSEVYDAIKKHDYKLKADYKFPKWTGTVNITLSPDTAKALVEHDNKIQAYKKYKNNNRIADKDPEYTRDIRTKIELEDTYEIRKGQRYLEFISNLDHGVDVEITVYNDSKDPKILFCDLMKNSVTELYSKNNKILEQLDQEIWRTQLLSIIKEKMEESDITKESFVELLEAKEDFNTIALKEPLMIGIISKDRSKKYPDKIVFVNNVMDLQTNNPMPFIPCDLIPSLQTGIGYALKPGYYQNVLFATSQDDGFIQANPVAIYTVTLNDNKIQSYEKTDYEFMRITFPLQEDNINGIYPMGAAFENDTFKQTFIDSIDFNLMHIYKSIRYIILEDSDFE